MNVSARELAVWVGVSARTIGRFERDGLLARGGEGKFPLQASVQRLLDHFMVRERWAFQQLRRHRIFDEQSGDVFEPKSWRL